MDQSKEGQAETGEVVIPEGKPDQQPQLGASGTGCDTGNPGDLRREDVPVLSNGF